MSELNCFGRFLAWDCHCPTLCLRVSPKSHTGGLSAPPADPLDGSRGPHPALRGYRTLKHGFYTSLSRTPYSVSYAFGNSSRSGCTEASIVALLLDAFDAVPHRPSYKLRKVGAFLLA